MTRISTTTATTESTSVALEKGLGRRLAFIAARVLAPGMIVTLLAQHVIVLPAALAPAASFLGLHVGA